MKDTEDDGITVMVAQRNRLGRPRDLVALRLVVTEHIGAQGPLLAVGSGSFVVGNPLAQAEL